MDDFWIVDFLQNGRCWDAVVRFGNYQTHWFKIADRGNDFSFAGNKRGFAIDAKRNVRINLEPDFSQLTLFKAKVPQFVQTAQNGGHIGWSAAHSGRNGNVFINRDFDAFILAEKLLQFFGSLKGQVAFITRQKPGICSDGDVCWIRFGLNVNVVGKVNGNHDHFPLGISVRVTKWGI